MEMKLSSRKGGARVRFRRLELVKKGASSGTFRLFSVGTGLTAGRKGLTVMPWLVLFEIDALLRLCAASTGSKEFCPRSTDRSPLAVKLGATPWVGS